MKITGEVKSQCDVVVKNVRLIQETQVQVSIRHGNPLDD